MFEYPVLICKDFGDFIPTFSPQLMISLRSYIKHLKECLHQVSKHAEKWVEKTRLCIVFQPTSRCLDILMEVTIPCV